MLPPEICKYLFDIRQACERLVGFTAGKNVLQANLPVLRQEIGALLEGEDPGA